MKKKKRGGKKPYEIGRRFEYAVRDRFVELGYLVHRAYASKGAYDLIVVGHRVVMLVQAKVSGVLSPAGWNALWEACEMCSAVPVLVTREKRKQCFYQLLAAKNGQRPQPRILFAPEINEEQPLAQIRNKKGPAAEAWA